MGPERAEGKECVVLIFTHHPWYRQTGKGDMEKDSQRKRDRLRPHGVPAPRVKELPRHRAHERDCQRASDTHTQSLLIVHLDWISDERVLFLVF